MSIDRRETAALVGCHRDHGIEDNRKAPESHEDIITWQHFLQYRGFSEERFVRWPRFERVSKVLTAKKEEQAVETVGVLPLI